MRATSLDCFAGPRRRLALALAAGSLIALAGCPSPPKQVGDYPSEKSSSDGDEPTKWEGAAPPEAPKPKASGAGTHINEAPAQRKDQYDKDATEVVIKRAARQVKENCGATKGEDGKATGPWGKATVTLQLGSNGRSKGITVPAPHQGTPAGRCVEMAFAKLTYPPWGGSDAQIDWEIELVNPAEPDKKSDKKK